MNYSKLRWLAAGFIFLALLTIAQASEEDKSKNKSPAKPAQARPTQERPIQQQPTQVWPTQERPIQERTPPPVKPPTPLELKKTQTVNGGYEMKTRSGQVRERMEKKLDGVHTQYLAPTGRVQTEVMKKRDGTVQTTHYAPNGKVKKEVVINPDRTKQITNIQYGRDGKERVNETIKVDTKGRGVSKTVVVKQTTVIKNTTIVNNRIERHYDCGRYGFVYHPRYVELLVFVSWYDPYWYTPAGVVIVHPFCYSWGWYDYEWYRYHRYYWTVYEVYPAPSYWVTDWLIADCVAERYAASVSAEQAREDARIAQESARQANLAAQQAQGEAEKAEAQAAQAEAEARAAKAEARAAKAEAEEARAKGQANQPNPNATPIDQETKEALRNQIEKTIAEKKEIAEQAAKGKEIIPDLSKALADPNHIYLVSNSLSVTLADGNPAGTLTEGDLLRLEPGQENTLKDAGENTFVKMKVMTSKGEDDEVKAGSVINLPLKSLQDFDSEFQAKLDLGLAEAKNNNDQFKKGVLQ